MKEILRLSRINGSVLVIRVIETNSLKRRRKGRYGKHGLEELCIVWSNVKDKTIGELKKRKT